MDQISGTTPTDAPTHAPEEGHAGDLSAPGAPSGFGSRGRARRRARFLRKARELAYRDLGGLVFNLHRFGQRNDALVLAKLTTLGHIDGELRSIEAALMEREPITVLREAGITACPRCAAIHSSEDRFCPNCGLSMSRRVDLPVAGAAATPSASPPAPPSQPAPALGTPAPPATVAPAGAAQDDPAASLAQATPDAAQTPQAQAQRTSEDPPGSPSEDPPPPAPPAAAPSTAGATRSAQASTEEATEIIRPGGTAQ